MANYLPVRLLGQSQTDVKPKPKPKYLPDYFRHSIENALFFGLAFEEAGEVIFTVIIFIILRNWQNLSQYVKPNSILGTSGSDQWDLWYL